MFFVASSMQQYTDAFEQDPHSIGLGATASPQVSVFYNLGVIGFGSIVSASPEALWLVALHSCPAVFGFLSNLFCLRLISAWMIRRSSPTRRILDFT